MRNIARTIVSPLFVALLVAGLALAQAPQQSTNPPGQPPANQSAPVAIPMPASPPPSPQSSKQNPASVLRTSSDLVRIDVEVTDKSGKPIKGLRADQFVVTDNGKPQSLSPFSSGDIDSIEAAAADDSKPIVVPVDNEGPNAPSEEAVSDQLRDRRLIVLFFDITSMQTDDLIRAHDAAQKFVKQQMTKADVVAVVAFSTRLNVLANFTNDHAII